MTNSEKITVGIRADGNVKIGMGHLMRCMSVAKALQRQGVECVFLTADREACEFLAERGFSCKALDTDFQNMEAELPVLEALWMEQQWSLLLVDSYQITQKYLDALMNYCPVYYLDDMGVCRLKASGLINYNVYGRDMDYELWDPGKMELLLGAEYAPVKEQFSMTQYTVRKDVSKILITMGGSDTFNITGLLGEKLLQMLPEEIELELICGRFNPHLDKLRKLEAVDSRVHISVDVPDMWNKMAAADIAVSAAGSTLYELSTVGVPTVCCYYVENQRRIAEGFAKQVQMVNAGDFAADREEVLRRLTEEVCGLASSAEARKTLSQRMKQVTDGKGAAHIAKALKAYALASTQKDKYKILSVIEEGNGSES